MDARPDRPALPVTTRWCPVCKGEGEIVVRDGCSRPCPETGYIDDERLEPCELCDGTGKTDETFEEDCDDSGSRLHTFPFVLERFPERLWAAVHIGCFGIVALSVFGFGYVFGGAF